MEVELNDEVVSLDAMFAMSEDEFAALIQKWSEYGMYLVRVRALKMAVVERMCETRRGAIVKAMCFGFSHMPAHRSEYDMGFYKREPHRGVKEAIWAIGDAAYYGTRHAEAEMVRVNGLLEDALRGDDDIVRVVAGVVALDFREAVILYRVQRLAAETLLRRFGPTSMENLGVELIIQYSETSKCRRGYRGRLAGQARLDVAPLEVDGREYDVWRLLGRYSWRSVCMRAMSMKWTDFGRWLPVPWDRQAHIGWMTDASEAASQQPALPFVCANKTFGTLLLGMNRLGLGCDGMMLEEMFEMVELRDLYNMLDRC